MKSLVEINQQGLDNWGSNSRHFSDKGVPGDHSVQGQLDTFDLVWPKLNTNGVYCIEDVTEGGHKDYVIDSLKNKNLNIVIDTYYGNSRNDDIIIWITHAR